MTSIFFMYLIAQKMISGGQSSSKSGRIVIPWVISLKNSLPVRMLPAASNGNPSSDGLNNEKIYDLHTKSSPAGGCASGLLKQQLESTTSPVLSYLLSAILLFALFSLRLVAGWLQQFFLWLSLERKFFPDLSSQSWELGHLCNQSDQGDGTAPVVLDLSSKGRTDVEKSTPLLPTESHVIKMENVWLNSNNLDNTKW